MNERFLDSNLVSDENWATQKNFLGKVCARQTIGHKIA